VPPAPGDAGCALGAALYADRIIFGHRHRPVPDHPFWGPEIEPAALARLAEEDGFDCEQLVDDRLLADLADRLMQGQIIGWMDGATEFGPRALGARSILAAPHDAAMRDRLNRDIKYREEFRPFAPVVRAADADRFFALPPGGARLARFMSGVVPVRPEWREQLAAVTHVDGTARVQVLDDEMAPRLGGLLDAYGRVSGVPVLLNTSFNLAGEPIVNTVAEGWSTFRRSGIRLQQCLERPQLDVEHVRHRHARLQLREVDSWIHAVAAVLAVFFSHVSPQTKAQKPPARPRGRRGLRAKSFLVLS